MYIYLIDSRRDLGYGEELIKLSAREITDANGFGESKFLALLHAFPHWLDIHGDNMVFWDWGTVNMLGQPNWPVYQIEIHILQLKIPAPIKPKSISTTQYSTQHKTIFNQHKTSLLLLRTTVVNWFGRCQSTPNRQRCFLFFSQLNCHKLLLH